MPRRFCIHLTDGQPCGTVFDGDTGRCPPHQAAADARTSVVAYLADGPVPLRRFEGRIGSALEAALVHVRFMEREWLEKHGEVILP